MNPPKFILTSSNETLHNLRRLTLSIYLSASLLFTLQALLFCPLARVISFVLVTFFLWTLGLAGL
jgi:hypothetical protein